MKNRYGGDGMTYNAKINTSNGEFEILGEYVKGENDEDSASSNNRKISFDQINTMDKKALKNKFFEINHS